MTGQHDDLRLIIRRLRADSAVDAMVRQISTRLEAAAAVGAARNQARLAERDRIEMTYREAVRVAGTDQVARDRAMILKRRALLALARRTR